MDEAQYKVLRLIEEQPDVSQRELARKLGVSLGKVNYCLNALIDKGLVKAANFRRSNRKLAYAYLLTPRGVQEKAEITLRFLHLKLGEYEALRKEIALLKREVGK